MVRRALGITIGVLGVLVVGGVAWALHTPARRQVLPGGAFLTGGLPAADMALEQVLAEDLPEADTRDRRRRPRPHRGRDDAACARRGTARGSRACRVWTVARPRVGRARRRARALGQRDLQAPSRRAARRGARRVRAARRARPRLSPRGQRDRRSRDRLRVSRRRCQIRALGRYRGARAEPAPHRSAQRDARAARHADRRWRRSGRDARRDRRRRRDQARAARLVPGRRRWVGQLVRWPAHRGRRRCRDRARLVGHDAARVLAATVRRHEARHAIDIAADEPPPDPPALARYVPGRNTLVLRARAERLGVSLSESRATRRRRSWRCGTSRTSASVRPIAGPPSRSSPRS